MSMTNIKFRLVALLLLIVGCVTPTLAQYDDESDENYEVEFDQGTFYGVKVGVSGNNQNWSQGVQSNLLFTPLIDLYAETYNRGYASRLYSQLGFHQRGSSLGLSSFNNFASYKFSNVALELGGKRLAFDKEQWDGWYLLGLRAEYTLFNNLDQSTTGAFNVVLEEFVNNFNYGVSIGFSTEYDMGNYQFFFAEIVFSPDLSAQYDQTQEIRFVDPINPTQNRIIQPQQVRNFALELKVGYKWLN